MHDFIETTTARLTALLFQTRTTSSSHSRRTGPSSVPPSSPALRTALSQRRKSVSTLLDPVSTSTSPLFRTTPTSQQRSVGSFSAAPLSSSVPASLHIRYARLQTRQSSASSDQKTDCRYAPLLSTIRGSWTPVSSRQRPPHRHLSPEKRC